MVVNISFHSRLAWRWKSSVPWFWWALHEYHCCGFYKSILVARHPTQMILFSLYDVVPEGKVWNYGIGLTQLCSFNLPFTMMLDTPLLFWAEEHWLAAFLMVSYLVSWCLCLFLMIDVFHSLQRWSRVYHPLIPTSKQEQDVCICISCNMAWTSNLEPHHPIHLYLHYVDRLAILPTTTCHTVSHPAFFSVILLKYTHLHHWHQNHLCLYLKKLASILPNCPVYLILPLSVALWEWCCRD